MPEKLSQKPEFIFAREVLSIDPELPTVISEVMQRLIASGKRLPFIHFTPNQIIDAEGRISGTSTNVDLITTGGMKAMHTNVGGFVSPKDPLVNSPETFVDNPELFVKDCVGILRHYSHHGARLNHASHNPVHGQAARATPAAILIDGSLPVVRGSDYEDHFKLAAGAAPKDIIATISEVPRPSQPDEVNRFIGRFLEIIA